jgi:IS605 OrfB family transposase
LLSARYNQCMGKATQSQSQASPRAKNSSRLAQPACAEPRPAGAVAAGTTAAAVPLTEQGFRFALDPTAEQARVLNCWLGASRYWYNTGLAEVKTRLDKRADQADEEARSAIKLPWSYKGLCSVITASIRNEAAPWQRELPCGTYMAAFDGLGAALQNFSKGKQTGRKVGFPEFKRKGACHESVFFQRPKILNTRWVEFPCAHGSLSVKSKESLRKLIRLLDHDQHARIMRATITRHGQNYYVSFSVKRSLERKLRNPKYPERVIGVDVGIARQATLSTGQVFPNLRPLQHNLKQLRLLQRKLDRQRRANNPGNYLTDGRIRKGRKTWVRSKRMERTEREISRLHARVADQRHEAAHHLSSFLVKYYGVIGAETLNIKGMLRNKRLARHISDVGWGMILSQLKYKITWSDGSFLALADRFYPSSKTCSACGHVKTKLDLSERTFHCQACGLMMDRDENAAANLAQQALDEANAQGLTGLVIMRSAGKAGQAGRAGQAGNAGKAGQSVVSPLPEWVRGATDLGDTNLVDDQATAMNRNAVIVTAGEPACQ